MVREPEHSPVSVTPMGTLLDWFTGIRKHHDIDSFAYFQDIRRRLPSYPADPR
jgi:hypothetical protein